MSLGFLLLFALLTVAVAFTTLPVCKSDCVTESMLRIVDCMDEEKWYKDSHGVEIRCMGADEELYFGCKKYCEKQAKDMAKERPKKRKNNKTKKNKNSNKKKKITQS